MVQSNSDRFIPNRASMRARSGCDTNILLFKNKKTTCSRVQQFFPQNCKKPLHNNDVSVHQQIEILDAPSLLDNYYINVLDWNRNHLIAIALNDTVYVRHDERKDNIKLTSSSDYISSISWTNEGNILAIAASGSIQLWDVNTQKRLRTMTGTSRIGCLAWNQHVLTSGNQEGMIMNHDVRIANHHTCTYYGHTKEICGLKWSPDGECLASGGNDKIVHVWQSNQLVHTFKEHTASVKALAWCPTQRNVLATGGGVKDGCIRFWNCNIGSCIKTVDTKSQVCSILWSKHHKELISSHGDHQLYVWDYSIMKRTTELQGHTSRVLHMAISPDGVKVASAGGETLRIWNVFKKSETALNNDKKNLRSMVIR